MKKSLKIVLLTCVAIVLFLIFRGIISSNNSNENIITGDSIKESNTEKILNIEELEKRFIVQGRVGKALSLDKNSYVRLDDEKLNVIGKENFTVQAWFKPQVDNYQEGSQTYEIENGVDDILYKGNPYGKWFSFTPRGGRDEGGVLWFQFDDNLSDTSTMIKSKTNTKDRRWHHGSIVFERKGGNWLVKIYVDGVLENEEIFENYGLLNNSEPMVIGRPFFDGDPNKPAPSNNIFGYTGLVDEFYVFNRKLSEEEIMKSYNSGIAGNYSKISNEALLVYLSFDEYDKKMIFIDEGEYEDDYNTALIL